MNKEFLEKLEDELHHKIQDIRYKYYVILNDLKDPPSKSIELKYNEMYLEIVNSLNSIDVSLQDLDINVDQLLVNLGLSYDPEYFKDFEKNINKQNRPMVKWLLPMLFNVLMLSDKDSIIYNEAFSTNLKDITKCYDYIYRYNTSPQNYLDLNQNFESPISLTIPKLPYSLSKCESKDEYSYRIEKLKTNHAFFNNKFGIKLFEIVNSKKSVLCLSLDVESWEIGQKILNECGQYICLVKLHVALFDDWNNESHLQLLELSNKYNFLIMQDSKLIDVPKISLKQILSPQYNISKWADCITVSNINYLDIRNHFTNTNIVSRNNIPIELINVVEMNTKTEFFTDEYIKNTKKNIYIHNVSSIVSQKSFKDCGYTIRFSPGTVHIKDDLDLMANENMRSRYRSIETAIQKEFNHIVIIGSNILNYKKENGKYDLQKIKEKCQLCSQESWSKFSNTFLDLLHLYSNLHIL